MKKEIIEQIKNLKDQSTNNGLIYKIFDKKEDVERLKNIYSDLNFFLTKYHDIKSINYNKRILV